jgi:hypothetical protein
MDQGKDIVNNGTEVSFLQKAACWPDERVLAPEKECLLGI